MKHLLAVLILIAGSFTLGSCDNSKAAKTEKEATEQTGKEYTSAYVCPMHCEGSGSEEPGKCPVCGMDYVENKEDSHEGHNH